jgi:uncharacterized glyoxalase superfamily protein PhnB
MAMGRALICRGRHGAAPCQDAKKDAPADTPVLVLVEENVEATVRTLKSQGVKIITQPHRAPWMSGRIVAEFQDNEGIA